MVKQKVRYRALHYCKVGERALVEPVNHPNYRAVRSLVPSMTSEVLKFEESTGCFETRNTVYEPGPFADINLSRKLSAATLDALRKVHLTPV